MRIIIDLPNSEDAYTLGDVGRALLNDFNQTNLSDEGVTPGQHGGLTADDDALEPGSVLGEWRVER